ncbi:MAG TPA: HipA domain-containing protein [Steroidobacteraceae bacterium]|jgi:serine/threonine-protein kinase HipA|nr:HipA domain-containing protein [Steroidobacteraceae bacterium]
MNAPARELIASINAVAVGRLRDQANIWSFEYLPEWIASRDAYDLSPSLPRRAGTIVDGASERPVQWFFDNLLPEEQAREVFAKEAKLAASDAYGLLAYYGKESAGAITLLAAGETATTKGGYRALTNEALHERIAKLPRQSLAADAPKRMSNAGAQHKLAICVRDGDLFEPLGSTASTHLLKPDHVDRENWPSSVANEYFVMSLAARLGLEVPPVQLRYVPDPVYIIERFDRHVQGENTVRLHTIDACQALGLDRTFKYQQATVESLVRCIDLCANRARARQSLLQWLLFNILTGNGDAHLKNLSFRVHPDGLELAPFYDLVSTESYRASADSQPRWPKCDLSIQIGGARTFAGITREHFSACAEQLGVNPRAASRLLEQLTSTIVPAADALIEEFQAIRVPRPTIRAAQLRVLQTIRHAVIGDMVKRLKTSATRRGKARGLKT